MIKKSVWFGVATLPWVFFFILPWPPALPFARSILIGSIMEARGKLNSAASAYRSAVRIDHDKAQGMLAQVLKKLGKEALDEENSEQAVRILEEANRLGSGNLHTLLLLGLAYERNRNPELAMDTYSETSKLIPYAPDGPIAMGNLLWINGDRDGADKWYREAIKRAPYSGITYVEMARSRIWSSEMEEAWEFLKKSVEVDQGCAVCRYHRALYLEAIGKHQEATQEANLALIIAPTFANARRFLNTNELNSTTPEDDRFFKSGKILFDRQARNRKPAQ